VTLEEEACCDSSCAWTTTVRSMFCYACEEVVLMWYEAAGLRDTIRFRSRR
jgi:hypothetical protein